MINQKEIEDLKKKKTYNILEIKLILYVEANNFIINYNIPAQ